MACHHGKYGTINMAPNGDKDPISNITDKLRSLFVAGGHPKNKNAMPPKMRFSIGYFLLAILFFSYLQPFFSSEKRATISDSQFKQSIADGRVENLIIGPENIKGTMKGSSAQAFSTIRVDDPGLVKELDERHVNYSGQYENKFLNSLLSWILPLGFFFLIWRFAMKKRWWNWRISTRPSTGWWRVSRRKTG
jgi:cell division protease FtsH